MPCPKNEKNVHNYFGKRKKTNVLVITLLQIITNQ